MALKDLSSTDQDTIKRCLEFILQSRELDGEFQTRMGVNATMVEKLLIGWPEVDDTPDASNEAVGINNALNEVVNGLRISDQDWSDWFNVSREDVKGAHHRWATSRGWRETGVR
jgi:hypothetical protein